MATWMKCVLGCVSLAFIVIAFEILWGKARKEGLRPLLDAMGVSFTNAAKPCWKFITWCIESSIGSCKWMWSVMERFNGWLYRQASFFGDWATREGSNKGHPAEAGQRDVDAVPSKK